MEQQYEIKFDNMDERYVRNCPTCNKQIYYKSQIYLNRANKANKKCFDCGCDSNAKYKKIKGVCIKCKKSGEVVENAILCPYCFYKYISKEKQKNDFINKKYTKKCHECGKEICFYSIYSLKYSIKQNSKCLSCTNKETRLKTLSHPSYHSEQYKKAQKSANEKGRTITKEKYGTYNSIEIMRQKYGNDAEQKIAECKEKQRKASTGKNNPMYGKPSPQGTGNGWSGWYRGWFFRSLMELSYMINIIEKENHIWQSAETKEYKISYVDYLGQQRNYFPDFLIDNKYIVEIKPQKLHNSPKVLAKKEAAEKWCIEKGYEYKIVDTEILSKEKIKKLYNEKQIKFTETYERKFLSYYQI